MEILNFIEQIRESHPNSVVIFTQGGCYDFYKILKEEYPEAEPYYDSDHVITKIGENYYDITGQVEKQNHVLMTIEPMWVKFFEEKHI